ncbi:MAG TPA: transaldolase, partial [Gemmatales bacterium]|nr:transaldolase [Gemmatales bacterium]
MTNLQAIHQLGQSLWYDNMKRSLLTSGGFTQLIQQGIVGVTSNPAIFASAMGTGTEYDAALSTLVKQGKSSPKELYEELAIEDIRLAADLFRPVYESSRFVDGYVSLEVSPHLAHDTAGTLAEAVRLHARVDRPNLMIKVPATPAGLPAITELVSQGICVNVTLLFAVEAYEQVALAYMQGLEKRMAGGQPLQQVSSVASFFVSRIDTLVDDLLQKKNIASELAGKIAIANAYEAYAKYQELVSSSRWQALHAAGAQSQRLLWASTSTKNPNYPKTKYVDALIAPHTVNTIPPETVNALLESPTSSRTSFTADWSRKLQEARKQLQALAASGISLSQVTQQLLEEAIRKFA